MVKFKFSGGMIAALALTSTIWISAQSPVQTAAGNADSTYQEGAVLWMQSSGERRALAYQAFLMARMTLDRDLRLRRGTGKPMAVVVDIDETVLDNSRQQAALIKNHLPYTSAGWTDWVKHELATAIPGSVEFLSYAATRHVRVFYISNRNQAEKPATIENLRKMGFPDVSEETVLVRTDPKTSSKEVRRKSVESKFRIVLLVGDNLNDFSEAFEKSRTVSDRLAIADRQKAQFGTRFIVLPNPMYGDWESAIYGYTSGLSEQQKATKRSDTLEGY